jgi:hypothetical protein
VPIPVSTGSLADAASTRESMKPGASEVSLERLTFPDGTQLVLKAFSPETDWMMRGTHDTGRAAELWVSGAMDRLPPEIDPAIVRIEREGSVWMLYLRDVDQFFLRSGSRINHLEVKRFLAATARMHGAFAGVDVPGLATFHDLLRLLAPDTIERQDTAGSEFLGVVRSGWNVFHDLAPADVTDAIDRLLADPGDLVAAMLAGGTTLVHADLHYGNVAPAPDRFFVIDWALATAAPPAVDVAWYLHQSAHVIDGTREEVLAEFAIAEGPLHDARVLKLALLAEVVMAGWQYSDAVGEAGAARRADLDWWVARAREGLETL